MRRSALIGLTLLLLTPAVALAQDATTPARTKTIQKVEKVQARKEVTEKRQELRDTVRKTKEEARTKIKQDRAEKIKQFVQQLKKRLEATAERLDKLIGRVQERLDVLAKTQDVSAIQGKLDSSKTKLATAKESIKQLEGVGDDLVTSEDPKAAFKTVRDMMTAIKNDLVSIHRDLVSVIGDIKGLRVGTTNEKK